VCVCVCVCVCVPAFSLTLPRFSLSSLLLCWFCLCSRFLINLPDEELESFDRLFFQLQEASWFYTDFYSDKMAHLPKLKFGNFAKMVFQHSPILSPHLQHFDKHFDRFRAYINAVPVCGAIILTPNLKKCLLVKGWGSGMASWTFPKGKINKQEHDYKCAVREVFEEIGFDISDKIDSNQFVEATISGKRMRLFIIRGVPANTVFETRTRKEISEIGFFPVSQLDNPQCGPKTYAVFPFVSRLRKWISTHGGKSEKGKSSKNANQQNHNTVEPQSRNQKQSKKQNKPTPVYHDGSTFGNSEKGWDVKEMFTANARLFGVQSTVPQEDTVLTAEEQVRFNAHLARLGLSNSSSSQASRRPAKKQPKPPRSQQQQSSQSKKSSHQKAPQQQQQQPKIHQPTYNDTSTFGSSETGWDPQAMFAANARLFGVQPTVQPENTILTSEEQTRYDAHLARLGLSHQSGQTHKSPQKTRKRGQKSSTSKSAAAASPQEARPQQQPRQPKHKQPVQQQPQQPQQQQRRRQKQPSQKQQQPQSGSDSGSPNNAFLKFKFDTASIMGTFSSGITV